MSTETKKSGTAQGTATAKNNSKVETTNRPSIPGSEKEKNDGLVKTELGKTDTLKTEPAAQAAQVAPAPTEQAAPTATEPQAASHEQPKAEEMKEQPKAPEVQYIKPAMNLEQTVKYVDVLHRKNIQRLALIGRIHTLEEFQIKLAENADQLESNVFQGCKLTIEDDRGNKFMTNTPNLIAKVAQFTYDTCIDRLAEIEAEIVFPK